MTTDAADPRFGPIAALAPGGDDAALRRKLAAALAAEVPPLLSLHGVPGAQIAIGFRCRIIFAASFGVADAARGIPVTDTTVFKAASLAKPITALCVLRLVDRGILELDAPFENYTDWRIPAGRCHGHDPGQITLRRLLSHTSGLDVAKFPQIPVNAPAPSAREILDGYFGSGLTPHIRESPGSTLRYSGSNYELLRLVIESVCHKPLSAIAAAEVFSPLGLSQTDLGPPSRLSDVAADHNNRGHVLPGLFYPAIGSSGLCTTASELARLWLAIGGAPQPDGRPFLSPSVCAQLLTPNLPSRPAGRAFGLGVALASWGERPIFKHAGIATGLFSLAEGTPGASVVVMTNSGDNAKPLVLPLVSKLTGRLIAALNQPHPPPPAAGH